MVSQTGIRDGRGFGEGVGVLEVTTQRNIEIGDQVERTNSGDRNGDLGEIVTVCDLVGDGAIVQWSCDAFGQPINRRSWVKVECLRVLKSTSVKGKS